jgi:hypothetical protein
MVTLPAMMLVTFKSQEYLIEAKTLVAPCNLYPALGKIINQNLDTKKWSITIEPTDIEYFMGDENGS